MATLLSVTDFRTRLDICDSPETNDKALYSLEVATSYLSEMLRTSFDRQALTDLFNVDPDGEPWDGDFPMLYLSQGFVYQPETLTLKLASSIPELPSTDAIDSNYRHVDATKGLVLMIEDLDAEINVPDWSIGCEFFAQADYTAGFTTDSDEFGDFYTGIPSWLREAATLEARRVFEMDSLCEDRKRSINCCPELQCLIDAHIRFYPYATHPML